MTESSPVEQADFDALLELLEPQTMRDVVRMFADSAPLRLTAAEQGITIGDASAVATAFHTLRSGCGQLGARRLEEMCMRAEHAAKRGEIAVASGLLAEVHVEYERCLLWFTGRGWLNA